MLLGGYKEKLENPHLHREFCREYEERKRLEALAQKEGRLDEVGAAAAMA